MGSASWLCAFISHELEDVGLLVVERVVHRARGDARSASAESTLTRCSTSTMPVRNSIDEMCPSPHARRLMTKRTAPRGTPF